MYNYSIMPLDAEHIEAVCDDIRQQYEQGVTNCALFCMTLMPEGNPVIPKAEILCEVFDRYYENLHAQGIPCGMLMQASIGHGYPLNALSPFQRVVNFSNGETVFVSCPEDEGFRDYIRHTMSVMASHHPDVIMVDDDFRLINARPGKGCFCPLHQKMMEERIGYPIDRETLWTAVHSDTPDGKHLREIYIQTQLDSLIGAARAMREGIDAVDSTIPGIFCCVGDGCEAAVEIASILAGAGNPIIIRLNNGNYSPAGARNLSEAMLRAATQTAILKKQGHVDALLAETDTCPQNRYSTGAQSLHSHFTGTILEGAAGAKHWITRLSAFEPNSGKAYRKILAKHAGFYEALSALVPTLTWTGCRIPVTEAPVYGFDEVTRSSAWATCVLERLGLPMYFAPVPDARHRGVTFLDGAIDVRYSDEELRDLFSHTVICDGAAAKRLTDRGLSDLMGVTAVPWDGVRISGELLPCGNPCAGQVRPMRLTPMDDRVRADSMCYHIGDGKTKEPINPGVTVYQNAAGGTAITFCGAAKTAFIHTEAFSMLNESRKRQFVDLLRQYGDLPLYYPGDADVYLRAAYMEDGGLFCACFNIGLDPIDNLELVCDRTITHIEKLCANGKRAAVSFTQDDTGFIHTDAPAYTLNPVILFLY